MIQDLHAHTYYSFCGKDTPTSVIQTAINAGIEVFGITDHSYGVGMNHPNEIGYFTSAHDYQRAINAYLDHLLLLKEKYAKEIKLKCGIEIPTVNIPQILLPDGMNLSGFDYCLIEHIDSPDSICKNVFDFAEKCGCKNVGIAHTDLPSFLDEKGIDKLEYFKAMAQRNIFWEMNVSFDSIHNYREHLYVKNFFGDKALQDIVRESGVRLSVGFDGHKIEDYQPQRVREACQKISELNVPLVFEK